MNKDTIYLEPEDDITDIIDKVKSSKSKIVALVPPKKSTVLNSSVNFRLLDRAGKSASKNLVLVTTDPALLKLAAAAEIPAAKNLQTRPEVPILVKDNTVPKKGDGTVDNAETSDLTKKAQKSLPEKPSENEAIEIIESEEAAEFAAEDSAEKPEENKGKPSAKKKKPLVPNLDKYRKLIIIGVIAVVLIVGFLIWALVIAPSVTIRVAIRTTGHNLTIPGATFVTDPQKADPEKGIFALEKVEASQNVVAEFTATGESNNGDKATGELTLTRTRVSTDAISIPKNTIFTYNEREYSTNDDVALRAPSVPGDCAGFENLACSSLKPTITAKVKVTAVTAGKASDLEEAKTTGWSSKVTGFTTTSDKITGGSDKMVKIISQKDFESAKSLLTSVSRSSGEEELRAKFAEDSRLMRLDDTLKVESKDPISSPKVGEEVPSGTTPQISAETVFSMYGVDRNQIASYIQTYVRSRPTAPVPSIAENEKIYSTGIDVEGKVYIKILSTSDGSLSGSIVASSIQTGPDITEGTILEMSKGKKIGEVRTYIKPLLGSNGNIEIEVFPMWLTSVPDDPNKITIFIQEE